MHGGILASSIQRAECATCLATQSAPQQWRRQADHHSSAQELTYLPHRRGMADEARGSSNELSGSDAHSTHSTSKQAGAATPSQSGLPAGVSSAEEARRQILQELQSVPSPDASMMDDDGALLAGYRPSSGAVPLASSM
jgi:hypothetical protein